MSKDWIFQWRANCLRVIDGDTVELYIDKGFHEFSVERIRLSGINCPELHGDTHIAGEAAKVFTTNWLDAVALIDGSSWPLIIVTHKADSFNRYIAEVTSAVSGASLNEALLASGNAVPFMVEKL